MVSLKQTALVVSQADVWLLGLIYRLRVMLVVADVVLLDTALNYWLPIGAI